MKIRSFTLKLILSYCIVIFVSFGFVAFFLDRSLEENSLLNIRASLVTQAGLIEARIPAESLAREDAGSLAQVVYDLSSRTKCRITVVNAKGKVLADSGISREEIPLMENHLYRPEIKSALSGRVGSDIRYSPTLKIDMLYVALPLKGAAAPLGAVRLALPLESVQRTLSAIRKTILLGLLFALGTALVLGSIVARLTMEPVKKMIQVSRRFSEGDFSKRVLRPSEDEIGELATALNRMAQDIEHKIGEIRTQNQKLAAVFNSMIEGVIVLDGTGRIVSVNAAIEKIFGAAKGHAEGKVFLEAIRNNDIAEVISAVLKAGKPVTSEITLIYPVRGTFEVSAAPVFDHDAVTGCLVVIHDITELRRLEAVRSDFVANVSHELKTPLTSIKGFVETLLEGALEDRENNRNFLKIIQEHAERLNNLVEDLLSLSSLESKGMILDKRSFDLEQQLENVIAGFKSQLNKKHIKISNELPPHVFVTADKDRIEHVFTNLLDNAVKFNTENGVIRVYSREVPDGIKVVVEDSGTGIPEKDIPRIFERFYRVDKARSRELGGTGLGLSIVKHIIELHGGSVGVESSEGFGSRFWFILPVSQNRSA